jgi:Domain of unknown function (DUF4266)
MAPRAPAPRLPRARARLAATALLLAASLAACTPVTPYERARLAHPSMSANRLSGPGASHMEAVHEGATGGAIGAESGCGCN